MEHNKYASKAQLILEKSPLTREEMVQYTVLQDELYNIREGLQINLDKLNNPLKIVLMGEVKAGKSTLLNSLVGKKISPTNVIEATSTILEVGYSSHEHAVLMKMNENKIEGKIEDIFNILEENRNDQMYFQKCIGVKIGLPFNNLTKLHIVDTPGLATITSENADRTEKYIQNADIVIWVINGNYLGQADINEEILKVAGLGKPIIGVINRVDEVEADREELIEYLDNELGIYFAKIFALSAYEAFNAINNNDDIGLKNSGYNEFLYYLTHEIESKSEEVHLDSIKTSIKALLENEYFIHENHAENLIHIQDNAERYEEKLHFYSQSISDKIQRFIDAWIENELLKNEIQEIISNIDNMKVIGSKEDSKEIQKLVNKYFSEKYVSNSLEVLIAETNVLYQNEWIKSIEVLQKEIMVDIEQLSRNEIGRINNHFITVLTTEVNAVDGVKKGIALTGAWGMACAGYAAWLGPYAAYVSIGAAVSSILPPLLIAGAVVGAVAKVFSVSKEKNKIKSAVESYYSELKRNIIVTCKSNILNHIIEQNNTIRKDVINKYYSTMCYGLNESDVKETIQLIIDYKRELKKHILSLY